MNEPFKDFELDLDARDKKREIAHGILVFVAAVTIASLFACERGPMYSPELDNALTLHPIAEGDSTITDEPEVELLRFMDVMTWDEFFWSMAGIGLP